MSKKLEYILFAILVTVSIANLVFMTRPKRVLVLDSTNCGTGMTEEELKLWITDYKSRNKIDASVQFNREVIK